VKAIASKVPNLAKATASTIKPEDAVASDVGATEVKPEAANGMASKVKPEAANNVASAGGRGKPAFA
jgi:hypothetical protein